jgi:hypothetical protein
MSLTRTDTAFLLESDDGFAYWATMQDTGEAVLPQGDTEAPQTPNGDGYFALLAADDQVWRVSFESTIDDGELILTYKYTLSPDQDETTDETIRIQYGNYNYDLSLGVEDGVPYVLSENVGLVDRSPVYATYSFIPASDIFLIRA